MRVIIDKCGTPTEAEWPGVKNLPHFFNMVPKEKKPRNLVNYIKKQVSNVDPLALQLLEKLLQYNPEKRLSAKAALLDKYFTSDPLPAELCE